MPTIDPKLPGLGEVISRAGLRLKLARAFHESDAPQSVLGDWSALSEHGRAPYFKRADTALEVLDNDERPMTDSERRMAARLAAYQDATDALIDAVSRMATPENADEARAALTKVKAALEGFKA